MPYKLTVRQTREITLLVCEEDQEITSREEAIEFVKDQCVEPNGPEEDSCPHNIKVSSVEIINCVECDEY